MVNDVFIAEEGIIVGVPKNEGNYVLVRNYYLSADDSCGYPEGFFENVSEADLEEIGAEYLNGKWVELA